MKKLSCQVALGLSLSLLVSFVGGAYAKGEDSKPIKVEISTPSPSSGGEGPECKDEKFKKGSQLPASQLISLYYIRRAEVLKGILDKIAEANPCIAGTVIEVQGTNKIVLYGKEEQRGALERIIAVLDLPRERVNLEMWGILISSGSPEHLSRVMRDVNKAIDETQHLLRSSYQKLEEFTKDIPDGDLDPEYKTLLSETLGYDKILDTNHPLSMIDILIRIHATKDINDIHLKTAQNLCKLFNRTEYADYKKKLKEYKDKLPFQNYLMEHFQLTKDDISNLYSQNCTIGSKTEPPIEEEKKKLLKNLEARSAVLNFALQYSHLKDDPANFNPIALQNSAENLNLILTPIVKAINLDVEELFIEPTLAKIQEIVSEGNNCWWSLITPGNDNCKVEYAEVGKTSVAGLNGLKSSVSSTTVSAFDETGPLRLNELLKDAGELNTSAKDLLPGEVVNFGANAIPVASVVSLIAALSKNRSTWRGITSGVSVDITPSVLRNSASAELQIEFTTGPQKGKELVADKITGPQTLRPLSRIEQSTVSTTVYVDTLDIFALSTFNNQTTEDGGRWYIPVIGTVWEGVFSGIPIFGELFSFKNPPNSVQHQSIVLTNSFIVPTAMGLAHLYQPLQHKQQQTQQEKDQLFYSRCNAVENYINQRKININQITQGGKTFYIQNRSFCEQPGAIVPKEEIIPKKSRVRRGNLG